jgi:hypothetical protein
MLDTPITQLESTQFPQLAFKCSDQVFHKLLPLLTANFVGGR